MNLRICSWILGITSFQFVLVWSKTVQSLDENTAGEANDYRTVHIFNRGLRDKKKPLEEAPFGYRPGSPTKTNTCQHVRTVPDKLRFSRFMRPHGLDEFYQKYTEAYGIPVLSSRNVPDSALQRACYVLRFMLAGNSAIRKYFYRLSGRVAVIGKDEETTSIPENSDLDKWWDQRARGLGGKPLYPTSSAGEENLLCYKKDRYQEDIFLHETSHGVHVLGAAFANPGWDRNLRKLYEESKRKGLWARTYSMESAEEYFAVGVQVYFNVSDYREHADGVRGPIDTRPKLMEYDPKLYGLIKEVFPCENTYLKRCNSTRAMEDAQVIRMDCDRNFLSRVSPKIKKAKQEDCFDLDKRCDNWAEKGDCDTKQPFMHKECKDSCNLCDCRDKHEMCQTWAKNGNCLTNQKYMFLRCRKSCNQC